MSALYTVQLAEVNVDDVVEGRVGTFLRATVNGCIAEFNHKMVVGLDGDCVRNVLSSYIPPPATPRTQSTHTRFCCSLRLTTS